MARTITSKPSAVQGPITAGRTCEALETLADLPPDTALVEASSNTSRTVAEMRANPQYTEFAAAVCAMDPATVLNTDTDDARAIISLAEQARAMSPASILFWGGSIGLAIGLGITIAANR